MKKLNQKKIRWIINQKNKGIKNKEIASVQKISIRRVKQIYSEYKRTNEIPMLKKPGRKQKSLPEEHKTIIDNTYEGYQVGPLGLEKVIKRTHKIHIPHNAIYKYMLKKSQVTENPKKKKQRKWIRYEREHSLTMIHTDWCDYKGKHVILYEDDASRKIISGMEFDNQTTENSIIALDKAIEYAKSYGGINQLMTDHGTQFTANKRDKNGEADHKFEKYVKSNGIQLIHARVKHPQTNGKIEKLFDTYEKHRDRFEQLDEFIDWYNNKRPHMSLKFNKAETPSEAFIRKMRPEVWFYFAKHWF